MFRRAKERKGMKMLNLSSMCLYHMTSPSFSLPTKTPTPPASLLMLIQASAKKVLEHHPTFSIVYSHQQSRVDCAPWSTNYDEAIALPGRSADDRGHALSSDCMAAVRRKCSGQRTQTQLVAYIERKQRTGELLSIPNVAGRTR